MGTRLYQYTCEDCGDTVVTASHPKQDEDDVLWCPDCSAVEVDYTADLKNYDDPTIVRL